MGLQNRNFKPLKNLQILGEGQGLILVLHLRNEISWHFGAHENAEVTAYETKVFFEIEQKQFNLSPVALSFAFCSTTLFWKDLTKKKDRSMPSFSNA